MGDDSNTVFIGGLPFSVEEEALKKDFAECGEIESLRLPMNDEGRPRGIAFVKYKDEKGVEEALKFHETDYGGRTISVRKDGAMVESTGTKQTFADSDDDSDAPPKKKAKQAAADEAEEPKKKKPKKVESSDESS